MAQSYNRVPEVIARLQVAVDAAVLAATEAIAEDAKGRVPVDTGRLRDAIHVQVEPEGVYVIAGDNKAFYGHLVEHGHTSQDGRSVAPRPFLVPALEDNRERVVRAVEEAIRRAVG